jgi:PAS domain S-box-containing protein
VTPFTRSDGTLASIIDLRDVTGQKQAIDALRQSEERFRFMADSVPVMLWLTGTDGGCTYLNKGWLTFTGRSLEQELGYGWVEGIHPEDAQQVLASYEEAFGRREPLLLEHRLRRADGQYRWLLCSGAPRFTPEGAFAGYVGGCVDVTERHEADDLRREASVLKDQFLGLVSHELRTPIATIYGNGLLLLRHGDLLSSDDREQSLTDIVGEAEKLQDIIENLLLLTRLEAGPLEIQPLALRHVVAEEVSRFGARHPERAVAVVHRDGGLVALGQQTLTALVLRNLLSNAEKYSPTNTAIEVWTRLGESGETVICVRDSGIGLEVEEQDMVFSPFFRSRRAAQAAKGMGLGLAVCKRAVEAQGGRIGVCSEAGVGSEFWFVLPAAERGEV